MAPSSGQPSLKFLSLPTLQPNSTAKTTSYKVTQHVSPWSPALEGKQGKYQDESDQCRAQSKPEQEKKFKLNFVFPMAFENRGL